MSILSKFIGIKNNVYGKSNPIDFAKQFFKDSIDVGTAVVSVLSNTGIAGYKFHIPQTEVIKMESEVTDHYTDSNAVLQDHIARRPVTITLTGLQGEYFYSINEVQDTLAQIVPTLNLVSQFLPKLTNAAMSKKIEWANYQKSLNLGAGISANQNVDLTKTLAQNTSLLSKANMMWNELNGVDLFKLFQDIYKLKSAQTRAFLFLEAMWKLNKPFSVETTWKRYDNMIITSLQPVRDNNADITEFSVTFKQINFAQTRYESLNNAAGRTRQQLFKTVSKGLEKGEEVQVS
jgi:hypothetical protein